MQCPNVLITIEKHGKKVKSNNKQTTVKLNIITPHCMHVLRPVSTWLVVVCSAACMCASMASPSNRQL